MNNLEHDLRHIYIRCKRVSQSDMSDGGIINVLEHGVAADGVTNNTTQINNIIKNMKNGGMLFFPPGKYVTGSIIMRSNITIHISRGAELIGSDCKDDFPYVREAADVGFARDGRHAFISAWMCENIAIEGGGVINPRGENWWDNPSDKQRPRAIQTVLCDNVKIRDVTIKNSPIWTIHPVCCNNVLVDGVSIKNPADSPNTDGINPESCSNVRVSNCIVDVGDDCITLKSGTENDALQKKYACKNISIVNCTLLRGHGGIVIGSEMSGGVKSVVVSNCIFDRTDRGIRIKTRRKRGGIVEDVTISNLHMQNVLSPFTINEYYVCGARPDDMELFSPCAIDVDETTPIIRNISLNNITVRNAFVSAMYILGLPELPVSGLKVSNISVETVCCDDICDEAIMNPNSEKLQGSGIHLENIADSYFDNISVTVACGEALATNNVKNVRFNGEILGCCK